MSLQSPMSQSRHLRSRLYMRNRKMLFCFPKELSLLNRGMCKILKTLFWIFMLQTVIFIKEQFKQSSSGTTGKLLISVDPFALAFKTCYLRDALGSLSEKLSACVLSKFLGASSVFYVISDRKHNTTPCGCQFYKNKMVFRKGPLSTILEFQGF